MSAKQDRVELHDRWLRVPLAQSHADFHFKWLRHQCDQDRHPLTHERIVDSSEIPDDIAARLARIEDEKLVVEWTDGRTSTYPLAFLDAHAYARGRVPAPPPPSDVAQITLTRSSTNSADLEQVVSTALGRLDSFGGALVRRDAAITTPPEDETDPIVDAFAARGLRVIPTHFGRIEDLRTDNTTNTNTDQLGYTNSAIDLHTDQPFLDQAPRLQLLQSIRTAIEGGDNYLVDAKAAALHLRDTDRRAFDLLTTVPVHFHRRQAAFESLVVAPILSFSDIGSISATNDTLPSGFQVRYSYFTMAPHARPFAEMDEWYRAYDIFARIVRDPRNQYRFALSPGDFLLSDNHRMLHARTAFRGARWVRGIYFDR